MSGSASSPGVHDRRSLSWTIALALAAAVPVLMLEAALLRKPLIWLLGIVPDDAFYYLQVARHAAGEGRVTFDGLNPSTGFHPAWQALLSGVALFVHDRELLLRSALALSLFLHLVSAVLLVPVFRRWMSTELACCGAAVWFLSSLAILISLQAVESSLYAVALTLVLVALERQLRSGGWRDAATLGVALGAAFWCRTEAIVLIGVTGVFLLLPRRETAESRIVAALWAGGTALAVAVPWFFVCWMISGRPLQASGQMKALWARDSLVQLAPSARLGRVLDLLGRYWLSWPGIQLPERLTGLGPFDGLGPLLVAVLALVLLTKGRPDLTRFGSWLLLVTVTTGVVYGLFFADPQLWYRLQPALLLFVLTWCLVARLVAARHRLIQVAVGWGAILVALGSALHFFSTLGATYPWQRDVYESIPLFERMVPADQPVGAFNGGIPAYFGARRIINLDGLANTSVIPYWERHEFQRYLRDARISYVMDEESSLARARRFCSAPLPVTLLTEVPLTGWPYGSRRCLWQVAERPTVSGWGPQPERRATRGATREAQQSRQAVALTPRSRSPGVAWRPGAVHLRSMPPPEGPPATRPETVSGGDPG